MRLALLSPTSYVGGAIMALMALLWSTSSITQASEMYWVAGSYAATSVVLILGPIAALWASWELHRLRRSRAWEYPAVRPLGAILAARILPIWIAGILGLTLALICIAVPLSDVPGSMSIGIVISGPFIILGHIALGALAGRFLPLVVAAPTSILLSYLVLGLAPALEPFGLRHLTGFNLSCCSVYQVPDPSAVAAPLICSLAFTFGAWILLVGMGRGLTLRAVVACVLILVPVGLCYRAVSDLGPDPVKPRPTQELVCSEEGPKVCVWPENKSRLQLLHAFGTDIQGRLRAYGINTPDEATESRPAAWSFLTNARGTDDDAKASMLRGLVPTDSPPCAATEDWQSWEAIVPMQAWLETIAGRPLADLDAQYDPESLGTVKSVLKLPKDQQGLWFNRNADAIGQCNTPVAPTR